MSDSLIVNAADSPVVWATGLLRSLLDAWISALDDTGLFHPYFDRQWKRIEMEPRTLVSQCRLIYNFCRGYEVFGDTRFAEAARLGLSALQADFCVSPGLFRWAVDREGAEVDSTLDSYGHAFCVLALATAARVFDDTALASQARETWAAVKRTFTDDQGGLMWRLNGPTAGGRSQNPLMHAFEALMALCCVDHTGDAHADTVRLLAFVSGLSDFQHGRLVEHYTADWRPQPPERGGMLELGHACEWAFLLSDWYAVTDDPALLETGSGLLRTGLEWGLDRDGGLRDACTPDGRITASSRGLWQQCEAIRAVSRYVIAHGQTHLHTPLCGLLAFFQSHFVDFEYGGVFVSPTSAGRTVSLDKGNAWKLDYHTINMCLELLAGESGLSDSP